MSKERFEFRSVFNEKTIFYTASQIKSVYCDFNKEAFIAQVMEGFETLSFGDRMRKITQGLYDFLPKDFERSAHYLIQALGPPIQTQELEGYEGFYIMPMSHYIAEYGQEYYETSMQALLAMTQRFTAEFPIRTFLINNETETLQRLHTYTQHPNCHVRRLASEGSRPRLPLAQRLHAFVKDPTPVLALLDALKNEPTRLVQRSIANNLNDIAKDNPDRVTEFLQKWKEAKVKDVAWIINHATRSLVKEGHKPTLRLLGFDPEIKVLKSAINLRSSTIILGESLNFEVQLHFENEEEEKVVIDYLLHFKKANAETKPKVFKLTTKTIPPKASLNLQKKHPIKFATTRAYYEGIQFIELQVNGNIIGKKVPFTLTLTH